MNDLLFLLKYAFLGLLQGFTEPIPISSSGHLVLAEHLLGLTIEGLSFEVLVNFASLLAVLLIYREDLTRMTWNTLRYIRTKHPDAKADFTFVIYLILATIPTAAVGIVLNDLISNSMKGITIIAVMLLVTGVALWIIRNLKGAKTDKQVTWRDALIIGLAQCVALIPGMSRSGATIVAAMGMGLRQDTALRFSFLLYIPISIGGMILEVERIVTDPHFMSLLIPYSLAFMCSLIASYYALRWFMGIMARGNLYIFALYCFVTGTAVLLFF